MAAEESTVMDDEPFHSSAMLNELRAFINEKFNRLDEKLDQLNVDMLGRCDERLDEFYEKMSVFLKERFDAVDERLNRLTVDVRGGFSEIHKRLAKRESPRASERPMEFTEDVEILSDDSSSETENDQQKNGPSAELPPEVRLFRSAQSYQEHMKMIPIPRERGTVIPFNSWVGLANSVKQIYGQPLHYLTDIHLKKLDEARLGAEDADVPLEMIIHPCKAEACIWILEETHRRTASPHFLAKLWSSDPMYDAYVDAGFVKL